ncbi:hypothetical protein [Actinokineospora sp. NBRC 105648]|uniref:hypothetical protein n=1 Tax=Actinokineospora sp. NBRC 105648 TaxID=3032206 RepID=UPI0024A04FFB|nr:hypothetical protein [Actinokineospora sp. NBRC 105648]GLZ42493.1 hypothetical protein Acsp05_61170 [Actinokineospora sp. NBRC 105648]
MDQLNPYETPKTFQLHRAEYLFGVAVVTGLMIANFSELRWWVVVAGFFYIDVIGYLPGAIAYKKANGGPVPKIYYVLYNFMHSFITQGAVILIWCLTVGPEWALLIIPFHLFGDRGLFGNFMKPFALPFEPEAQPAYQKMLDALGVKEKAPKGHEPKEAKTPALQPAA